MQARNYDPEIGRFLQVDPILSEPPSKELLLQGYYGISSYNYVFNNPLRLIDPDGRMADCPDCNFISTLKFALSKDNTYLGDLFRSDQQGQLEQKISQDLNDVGNAAVDAGADFADKTSDASTIAAAGGIVAAPFTGGSSLVLTGYALTVGTVADATSTGFKTVDAVAFDGSTEAAFDQLIKTGVNVGGGKLTNKLGSAFIRVVQTGGQATRIVPASQGFLRARDAAVDATKVAITIITEEILKNRSDN